MDIPLCTDERKNTKAAAADGSERIMAPINKRVRRSPSITTSELLCFPTRSGNA